MKKILILLVSLFLTGCTTELSSNLTIDSVIGNVTKETIDHYNTHGKGFKYYKPRDFSLLEDSDFNHILLNNGYKYYLNVDIHAYYNKKANSYTKDNTLYYSNTFVYNGISGFLEIRNGFNGYFYLKMMYNYSYIEVSVKEEDIKEAVINSSIILSSIKYNDNVIEKLINSGDLDNKETNFEVEKPEDNKDSNILDVYEQESYNE